MVRKKIPYLEAANGDMGGSFLYILTENIVQCPKVPSHVFCSGVRLSPQTNTDLEWRGGNPREQTCQGSWGSRVSQALVNAGFDSVGQRLPSFPCLESGL